MVVASVKDSVEARPTGRPSIETRGKGCFSVVNNSAATLDVSLRRCALRETTRAYTHRIYDSRRVKTRRDEGEEGGREEEKRDCIVECSRRRCSVSSSGCNEQNGGFLGEYILGHYSSSWRFDWISVDECNISLSFFFFFIIVNLHSQVLQSIGIFRFIWLIEMRVKYLRVVYWGWIIGS